MLNKLSHNAGINAMKRRSLGFTLIEALVAILVLSVGLLGIAAMQLKATQSSHLAYNRSMATLASQDAVERLWAEFGDPISGNVGDCPSASMISEDWVNNWSALLPFLPSANISSGLGDACKYTITVAWADDRFTGEGEVSNLLYIVKLPGG